MPLLVTAVLVSAFTAGGPAVAAAVYDAVNADKVDGKHAVSAGATTAGRAGKLVATDSNGRLPNNIIAKAPNAKLLDGLSQFEFLRHNESAVNSEQLDGLDGAAYALTAHESSFIASEPQSGTLPPGSAEIATATLTAPADGFVVVTARATFNARQTGTYLNAEVVVDGNGRGSAGWEPGDVDSFYDATNQFMTVAPVLEGTHTVALNVFQGNVTTAAAQYDSAVITVQYFHQAS